MVKIAINKYETNLVKFQINDYTFTFSFSTCIAFENKGVLVISEFSSTDLNPTRGHLDKINPDKSIRISRELFEEKLKGLAL